MEEKKIITTEEEISILIGLAADQVCDSHEKDKENLILVVAADICKKVNDHLTGRKKFSADDVEQYTEMFKDLCNAFGFVEKILLEGGLR